MNQTTEEYVQAKRDDVLNSGIGGIKTAKYNDPDAQATGWRRDPSTDDKYDFDEISPYGLDALARVCREGHKHGKSNWREHPQPESVVLNHAIHHLNQYRKGDREEDHLAKVAWGMFALIHYRDQPEPTESSRT